MTKISFTKYPLDILICLLCNLIILPFILLNIEGTIRIILGLPIILYIPGYLLIFILFPYQKTTHGITVVERIALSLCVSVAIIPLFTLALNYSPYGIQLESIFITIFFFNITTSILAYYRWRKTSSEDRFIIVFDVKFLKSNAKFENLLNIILTVFIVSIIILLAYAIIIPKNEEHFTEFYLLSPEEIAANYTTTMVAGQNYSAILGIVNHENRIINYTIDVWLINQTIFNNETALENMTIYHNMLFIDKITVQINNSGVDIEKQWNAQWEKNFTFQLNKKGNFKLEFLLFLKPTEEYFHELDYHYQANEIINSSYRETHFWVTVI
jgi:uncharacterized membrane protein